MGPWLKIIFTRESFRFWVALEDGFSLNKCFTFYTGPFEMEALGLSPDPSHVNFNINGKNLHDTIRPWILNRQKIVNFYKT